MSHSRGSFKRMEKESARGAPCVRVQSLNGAVIGELDKRGEGATGGERARGTLGDGLV